MAEIYSLLRILWRVSRLFFKKDGTGWHLAVTIPEITRITITCQKTTLVYCIYPIRQPKTCR